MGDTSNLQEGNTARREYYSRETNAAFKRHMAAGHKIRATICARLYSAIDKLGKRHEN